jgi:hypothetical protein
MSEQKPKKDLRARLGRTISPNTPGAPPIAAPGGVIAPPAVTPPPVAAPAAPADDAPAAAAPAPAVTPPPAAVAPPAIAPPIAAPGGLPFGGPAIAAPPFAKPAEPPPPEPKKRSADPFASAAPAAPAEFRIAIDDKPVDNAEVGRQGGGRAFAAIAASLLVGAALGAGVGTMNSRRALYNTTVTDGHAIYTAVDTASRGVLEAQQHIEALATSAGSTTVNYDELTALTNMPNPLPASAFADRNYNAFQPGTVDDLFTYYNSIQTLWRQFHHLAAVAGATEPPSVDDFSATSVCPNAYGGDQRAAIAAAAEATRAAAQAQYVGVLTTGADGVRTTLRFAEPELDASSHQPTGHILVHAAPGDTGTPVELWTPDTAITATGTHAIVIANDGSANVLSERLGAFRTYVQALTETRQLMTSTIEVQGRLTTSLGDIARLEEVFAF